MKDQPHHIHRNLGGTYRIAMHCLSLLDGPSAPFSLHSTKNSLKRLNFMLPQSRVAGLYPRASDRRSKSRSTRD